MSEEIFLEIPNGRISTQQWNCDAQEKMLMIHGWLDNSESFHLIAPKLADSFHVVAVDMSGHGRSFHRSGLYGYQNYDYQVDTKFIIDALGWNNFHLACHSMGASIASIYAVLWPEQVETLHLFDAYMPMTAEPEEVIGRYRSYIKQIQRSWRKEPRCFSNLSEAVQVRCDATPDLARNTCERIVRRNLQKIPDGGYQWCFDEKLKLPSPLRLSMEHLRQFDRELILPVQIYLGDNSPYRSFHPLLNQIAARRDNMTIHHFACGHYPHVDKADEIAGMILQQRSDTSV